MSEESGPRVDVTFAAGVLTELHEQVTRRRRRIEITHDGDSCVLISKVELAALERALEILSETEGFRVMSGKVAQLAAAVGTADYLSA
jgi:PHD/YefM family antitoxin component YafN of YafNO toxin-antitoxin module